MKIRKLDILSTSLFFLIPFWMEMSAEDHAPLPWMSVTMEDDPRDSNVKAYVEKTQQNAIIGINDSHDLQREITLVKTPVTKLLEASCPFGALHYDAVQSMTFTENEKNILREYFKRGGFLLFMEDSFQYTQEEFRLVHDLPVFNFLTQELPKEDPEFSIEKATSEHPIYRAFYTTNAQPPIEREIKENPYYRGQTMIFYRKRLVAFFMGMHGKDDGKKFVPVPWPYWSLVPKKVGFDRMVNLYVYTMTH